MVAPERHRLGRHTLVSSSVAALLPHPPTAAAQHILCLAILAGGGYCGSPILCVAGRSTRRCGRDPTLFGRDCLAGGGVGFKRRWLRRTSPPCPRQELQYGGLLPLHRASTTRRARPPHCRASTSSYSHHPRFRASKTSFRVASRFMCARKARRAGVAGGSVAERRERGGLGSWTSALDRVVGHLHRRPPDIHHHLSVSAAAGHRRCGVRRGILYFCGTQGGGGGAPPPTAPPPPLPAGVAVVGDGATEGAVYATDGDSGEGEVDMDPPTGVATSEYGQKGPHLRHYHVGAGGAHSWRWRRQVVGTCRKRCRECFTARRRKEHGQGVAGGRQRPSPTAASAVVTAAAGAPAGDRCRTSPQGTSSFRYRHRLLRTRVEVK